VKTAEQWWTEISNGPSSVSTEWMIPLILKIQSDAHSQGMRDAAEICRKNKKEVTAKHWELRALTQEANATSEFLANAILATIEQKEAK